MNPFSDEIRRLHTHTNWHPYFTYPKIYIICENCHRQIDGFVYTQYFWANKCICQNNCLASFNRTTSTMLYIEHIICTEFVVSNTKYRKAFWPFPYTHTYAHISQTHKKWFSLPPSPLFMLFISFLHSIFIIDYGIFTILYHSCIIWNVSIDNEHCCVAQQQTSWLLVVSPKNRKPKSQLFFIWNLNTLHTYVAHTACIAFQL